MRSLRLPRRSPRGRPNHKRGTVTCKQAASPLPFPNNLKVPPRKDGECLNQPDRYNLCPQGGVSPMLRPWFGTPMSAVVNVERAMNLERLVAARLACTPAPSWSAILTKAFAVVAARNPIFRASRISPSRGLVSTSTPQASRRSSSIANSTPQLLILYAHIDSPESLTLREIDAIIRDHKQAAPWRPFRRIAAVRMSRIPWPFRRLVLWGGLNTFGSLRCRFFGTFGITSVGSQGAGITHLLPLLTCQLHYGIFDPAGGLAMRVSFDHRVLDGATAAQGLADLEEVLLDRFSASAARRLLSRCPLRSTNRAPIDVSDENEDEDPEVEVPVVEDPQSRAGASSDCRRRRCGHRRRRRRNRRRRHRCGHRCAAIAATAAATPPPASFGRASLTVRDRPDISLPLSAAMAACASWSLPISTKPKPFERPVSRSMITCAERTEPCA